MEEETEDGMAGRHSTERKEEPVKARWNRSGVKEGERGWGMSGASLMRVRG